MAKLQDFPFLVPLNSERNPEIAGCFYIFFIARYCTEEGHIPHWPLTLSVAGDSTNRGEMGTVTMKMRLNLVIRGWVNWL